MSGRADESSVPNKGIKIGLIVVLLGAAGIIAYTQRSTTVEQSDEPETATTYVCAECGYGVDLTAARYAEMVTEGNKQRQQTGETRGSSSLQCPECHKFAMAMGARCPKDGTPIPKYSKDGKPGRCKKCGYSFTDQ